MKILVAEDDPVARMLLGATLKRLSHEVILAEDGLAAVTAFLTSDPQVVLTDWRMPKLSGVDLCKAIRSDNQRKNYAYIIMLTSLDDKASVLEALDAGADDFLAKPADADMINARLKVAERILKLQREMTTLRGLMSMCAHCKKVRDGDVWVPVERYIESRTEAEFSHGMCEPCLAKHHPP